MHESAYVFEGVERTYKLRFSLTTQYTRHATLKKKNFKYYNSNN
jgi:hypothetical protein